MYMVLYLIYQMKKGVIQMMTREENILWYLNNGEQKIKAILEKDSIDQSALDEAIAYVSGMRRMLGLLGYTAVEDADKSEYIHGYWVYTYKAIEDRR